MNWNYKEVWTKQSDTFCVSVEHFAVEVDERWMRNDGGNRWCVYVYIYPKHPLFKTIIEGEMFQDALIDFPLHCGCSFIKSHRSNKAITSHQIGCDYNHCDDERYTMYSSKEDASGVFYDAEQLIKFMKG